MKKEVATLYKIKPPMGNVIMEKDIMTEQELREFIPTLVQDPEQSETWKEKAEKDSIEELVGWLQQAGYEVSSMNTLK